MTIAKSLMMFHRIESASIKIEQSTENNILFAKLSDNDSLLMISLKEVKKGYYCIAYHFISNDNETSQDYSLPFPAYYAPAFIGAIANDVFTSK